MVHRLSMRPMLEPPAGPAYEPFVVIAGAFTERQCDRISALADDRALEPAGLQQHDGDTDGDEQVRRSRVGWLPPSEDTNWIYQRLSRIARRANRLYGFDLSGFAEDLQLTSYDESDAFYTWHVDGLDTGVSQRKLSIVVQLSDPDAYQGALLEFLPVTTDYDDHEHHDYRQMISGRGTAVVFPSFEYHRVTPLVSGKRLSLVSWVSGPRFR